MSPLDVVESVRSQPKGKERNSTARELREIVRLWLYWEKHVEPPRKKLLRNLQRAEQALDAML